MGHEVEWDDSNGSLNLVDRRNEDPSAFSPDASACEDEWMGDIGYLYYTIKQNPDHVDWDDLVAECFVQSGFVQPGFGGTELKELRAQASEVWRYTEDESGQGSQSLETPAADPTPTLPGGHPLYDEETEACLNTPQTAASRNRD
jgi:hypothetical protein